MRTLIDEFRLSRRGSGGVFCDEGGAFVGAVPMLARTRRNGKDEWRPRDCDDLSKEMSAQYGLPIDMSSKRGGLTAIAKALNEGDVVRAQVATVLLGVPDPPSLSKGAPSREEMIKLASDLHSSGLLKADWDPDNTRAGLPARPDSQGGQFAPKGADSAADQSTGGDGATRRTPPADARDVGTFGRSAASRFPVLPRIVQSTPHRQQRGRRRRAGVALRPRAVASMHATADTLAACKWPTPRSCWDGLGIIEANPADWANVARLANGALRLGSGLIITAPALLTATDAYGERADVNDAISKFELMRRAQRTFSLHAPMSRRNTPRL